MTPSREGARRGRGEGKSVTWEEGSRTPKKLGGKKLERGDRGNLKAKRGGGGKSDDPDISVLQRKSPSKKGRKSEPSDNSIKNRKCEDRVLKIVDIFERLTKPA